MMEIPMSKIPMSTALLKQNLETLQRFKVGQNVIIHDSDDWHVKRYGWITGFSYNSMDELLVTVSIATMAGQPPDSVDLHPLNAMFSIQIV
jgi:hypothetical protein